MAKTRRTLTMVVNQDVEIREETLFGDTYTVVPVIAMVEGVRFGANQESAELGLAADFGENESLWNNRPLVLNHPQNAEGNFVSANSSGILEAYSFGITMAAYVEDSKLKMEAWISQARVNELGGEFEDVYNRILAKDPNDVVEVSVGFFCDVQKSKGKFKGQTYTGIWKNIKPDHLAILPNSIGACSVDDGCGIPRINQTQEKKMSKDLHVDDSQCNCEDKTQCTCNTQEETTTQSSGVPKIKKLSVHEARVQEREKLLPLVNQQISSNVFSRDVMQLLQSATATQYGPYSYVYGFTQDFMIFDDYVEGQGYKMFKQGINVSENKVEFVGEKSEVILLTRLVDLTSKEDLKPTVVNTEDDMPNDTTEQTTDEKVTANTVVVETKKDLTAQEYIDQAPAEVKEVLQRNMRMYEEQKASLIKSITAQKGNKFTEDELKTHSIESLEKLISLAQPSFAGQAAAAPTTIRDNVSSNVVAPKVFEKKTTEQAA